MRNDVRRFGFVMAILMLMSALAGCGNNGSETKGEVSSKGTESTESAQPESASKDGENQQNQEVVEIDWYVDLSWWTWNGEQGFGNDLISKEILEKTGVKINFIVPASDNGEQLSAMIASETLPDLITMQGWWDSNSRMLSYQMAMEDYIWSYNDLMEQYLPDMQENIRQDVFNWFEEKDGKTYVLPNYAYSSEDLEPGEQLVPNGCITIRKDLYEAIGSPDMSTPENFLAACQKVKDEIGTYNGQEIIPIQLYEGVGSSAQWLSQYFATPYEDENGNYLYDFEQENYKEALKFLNTAYQKGLITDANLTDTRDLVNEKIASGRVFCQITAPQDFNSQMGSLYDSDPNAVYIPVVLKNSKGEDPVLQDIRGFGWLVTVVSKGTKHPEAIVRLVNFLLSDEGQILTTFGVEGVTYDYSADGKIQLKQEVLDDMANDNAKKYALSAMNLLANYAFTRTLEQPATDSRILAITDTYIKVPVKEYSFDFNAAGGKADPSDPRRDAMSQLNIKISNYRTTAIAELVTAKSDTGFEGKYEEVLKQLEDMGLEDLKAYNNDNFQNAKIALGIERSWAPLLD